MNKSFDKNRFENRDHQIPNRDPNSQGLAHKQKSDKERKDQKGFDSTEGDDREKNEENLEKTPIYDEEGKKL